MATLKKDLIPKINEMRQEERKISEENNDQETKEGENTDQFFQDQLVIQQIQDQGEYLKNRENQLNDIHKNAAHIKSMTDQMVVQLNEQKEKLDTIEVNVEKTNENVNDAKKEIIEADKMQKQNNKKYCCFIVIIFMAIAGITAILLSLLIG